MVSKNKTVSKKGWFEKALGIPSIETEISQVIAPEGKSFFLYGGGELKTISDLHSALKGMSEEVFNHHTKEGRNDFSNWLWHVFGEKKVADKLFKAKDLPKSLEILEKAYF